MAGGAASKRVSAAPAFTEAGVVGVLTARHADDLCVPGCKDGPTGTGMGILDLWVMARSWAHPRIVGYEVKVSRGDFLSDAKWMKYLPVCNELYFAAPPGVVEPRELPDGVGLVLCTKAASRIKVKARWREVEPARLLSLMTYVLMSRTAVTADMWDRPRESKAAFWHRWLAQREDERAIGGAVAYAIGRLAAKQVRAVREENEALRAKARAVDELADTFRRAGVDPASPWAARAQVAALTSNGFRSAVERARAELDRVLVAMQPPETPSA